MDAWVTTQGDYDSVGDNQISVGKIKRDGKRR
jgi:hypothetical protein